ncbi:DNA cytosine methyltransferase [archaeon]|jgi:DNA (cytosine-5)-methyltransferase 1|nr:DNA cytosine methyltransferase [archaeon]MBT6606534.1 DNA cytosine methyltransferase [archaeon]
MKMRVVSLFSGCGGLDMGFIKEGFSIIWANDIENNCCETYKENISEKILCKNILDVDIGAIPNAEVVIGGPPCQGFSGLGKRDPRDIRSKLVWTYLKIIEKIKPKIFLLENVVGLKSARDEDGKEILKELIGKFKDIGYEVSYKILNAADYGVPQRRKRIFLIGSRGGINVSFPNPSHSEKGIDSKKWVSVFEAISDLPEPTEDGVVSLENNVFSKYQKWIRDSKNKTSQHITPRISNLEKEIIPKIPPGGNYKNIPDRLSTIRIKKLKELGRRTTLYGRLLPDRPSYTLTTFFNRIVIGCNIHYKQNRTLTLREGMRLQSFPDSFNVISSTKQGYYVQIGNAVPPLLSRKIAREIKKALIFS